MLARTTFYIDGIIGPTACFQDGQCSDIKVNGQCHWSMVSHRAIQLEGEANSMGVVHMEG